MQQEYFRAVLDTMTDATHLNRPKSLLQHESGAIMKGVESLLSRVNVKSIENSVKLQAKKQFLPHKDN
jgi:hypothetical protein